MGFISRFKNLLESKRFRWLFASVVLIVLVVGGLTGFLYYKETNKEIALAMQSAEQVSSNLRSYLDEMIFRNQLHLAEAELKILAPKNRPSSDELSQGFYGLKQRTGDFEIMMITDAAGFYLANSEWIGKPDLKQRQLKMSVSDRVYYQELKNNSALEYTISKPVRSKTTGNLVAVMAKRRYSENGDFAGLLVVTMSIKQLGEIFAKANLVSSSNVSLLYSDNTVMVQVPGDEANIGQVVGVPSEVGERLQKGQLVGAFTSGGAGNDQDLSHSIFGFAQATSFGLRVIWSKSQSEVLAVIRNQYINVVGLELIILALFASLLALYGRGVERAQEHRSTIVASSKMASLGELAAGLGHEISNPLAAIIARSEILLRKPEVQNSPSILREVTKIFQTSERISKIMHGLKNLSHTGGSSEALQPGNLRSVIDDVISMVEGSLFQNSIELRLNIDPELCVLCRSYQIGQVVMNLFSNSIYELKKQQVRWIQVEAAVVGDLVQVSFTDAGAGIPPEVRKKLLVTNFTSKPTGVGTGFGLSISRKILLDHGGDLTIDGTCSNTRFVFTLKRCS